MEYLTVIVTIRFLLIKTIPQNLYLQNRRNKAIHQHELRAEQGRVNWLKSSFTEKNLTILMDKLDKGQQCVFAASKEKKITSWAPLGRLLPASQKR